MKNELDKTLLLGLQTKAPKSLRKSLRRKVWMEIQQQPDESKVKTARVKRKHYK